MFQKKKKRVRNFSFKKSFLDLRIFFKDRYRYLEMREITDIWGIFLLYLNHVACVNHL